MTTKIAWADEVWNPVTGCTKVSAGCTHCYAEAVTNRFSGDFSQIILHQDRLTKPLHWKKPRRIFVNSMSDLFHKDVPTSFILDCFNVIADCPQHTFLILTKRPERIKDAVLLYDGAYPMLGEKVLPNVWVGVSAEDQEAADRRISELFTTHPVIRWVSLEPLLGPIDLRQALTYRRNDLRADDNGGHYLASFRGIDWVVVGGESGPHHRPCKVSWIADIVEQCKAAGVPCYVKQDSHRLPGQQGRILDDLWAVKEYPR